MYYHGIPQEDYDSAELRLLNYMDITTDPSGDVVTIEERIEDIKQRYGENSFQPNVLKIIFSRNELFYLELTQINQFA